MNKQDAQEIEAEVDEIPDMDDDDGALVEYSQSRLLIYTSNRIE
jgi:hypothetical protein